MAQNVADSLRSLTDAVGELIASAPPFPEESVLVARIGTAIADIETGLRTDVGSDPVRREALFEGLRRLVAEWSRYRSSALFERVHQGKVQLPSFQEFVTKRAERDPAAGALMRCEQLERMRCGVMASIDAIDAKSAEYMWELLTGGWAFDCERCQTKDELVTAFHVQNRLRSLFGLQVLSASDFHEAVLGVSTCMDPMCDEFALGDGRCNAHHSSD